MKKYILILLWLASFLPVFGQEIETKQATDSLKTTALKEVTIEAARVIQRIDGQLILPSQQQKERSTNGYSLLSKLDLPRIRVNVSQHSLTALSNNGDIQVRINGTIANQNDLLSLNPKLVKSIEFIDNPGVRYGQETAYVLNIKTIKPDNGGNVGVDLNSGLTSLFQDHTVFSQFYHKKSSFVFSYHYRYQNFHGFHNDETSRYTLNDNSLYQIIRTDKKAKQITSNHSLQLKYNLADSASYAFQAAFNADFNHTPVDYNIYDAIENNITSTATERQHARQFSPSLDLYFFYRLGSHQDITANMVGTRIVSHDQHYLFENTPFQYNVDGKTYSLYSEIVYENRLKPFTITLGTINTLKYTHNQYTNDANAENNIHSQYAYFFGNMKGMLSKLKYSLGLGATNAHYTQGSASYNYWLWRPKFSLSYPLSKAFSLSYSFEQYEHISKVAMISDAQIRTNSREWKVGNPSITPDRCISHEVVLSYTKPRFQNILSFWFKETHNPNLSKYVRTPSDEFLYMQVNQPRLRMFYFSNYFKFTIIPNKLDWQGVTGIYRFMNYGDDYRLHLTTFNWQTNLQAYLGKFTITAYADNGWNFQEGNLYNHNGANVSLTGTYQFKNSSISLIVQNPFMAHPQDYHSRIISPYLQKEYIHRTDELGNSILFNYTWHINYGHRTNEIKQRKQHKDTETGIM